MFKVKLFHTPNLNPVQIRLPGSKSESNRALVIKALGKIHEPIGNLSEARDTATMSELLASEAKELDVIDAGTTMRFLAAYFALTPDERVLTGSNRMLERPVGILVDALRELGADIDYLGVEGYPPLLLKPFSGQKRNTIKLKGNVSSQYISALLMIAPTLPQGLKIEIEGDPVSRPYIKMTLALMKEYGVASQWKGAFVEILPQKYVGTRYQVESDWSAASYWYSLVSLAENAQVILHGLRKSSYQGDQQIASIMSDLGVETKFFSDSVALTKTSSRSSPEIDFRPCPDLAQTVAVTCAGLGRNCIFRGIENLAIKETDRISALTIELKRIGVELISPVPGQWELSGQANLGSSGPLEISTYEDHRMAMAFAALAVLGDVVVQEPDVVNKSYPGFWKHLASAGIKMEFFHG